MSVSISLDNGTQLSMGIKIAFGDLHIMRHGIKIDLGPRAPVDMIHKTKPTFTKNAGHVRLRAPAADTKSNDLMVKLYAF